MANVTVQEVSDVVLDRLVSGVYPYSTKLPTARELAKEMGAHRNTVAKAYKALAEIGLVTLKQGRGTYVTGVVDEQNRTLLIDQIREGATELIQKSRRMGLAKEVVQKIIDDRIAEQYGSSIVRAAYVECNIDDTNASVEQIELLTEFRAVPLLLSTLQEHTEAVLSKYDVIITSLFHVKDVSCIIDQCTRQASQSHISNGDYGNGHSVKLIGVYTHPDEQALSEIAQIQDGARVAVIVSNQDGGRRLDLYVRTVGPADTILLVKPDDKTILDCVDDVDVLVCSRSLAPQMRALDLGKPVIVLPFHISQQSAVKIVEGITSPQATPTG